VRRRVVFERHNLLGDSARFGRFDIILLRNVLIYFDSETKRRVLDGLAPTLAADGFLLLGGTKTALGSTEALVADRDARGLWRPAPSQRLAAPDSPPPERLACTPRSVATFGAG
jgi:chemotaxis protein methyltransferase CheR